MRGMSFERFISIDSSDSGVIWSIPRGSSSNFFLCDAATSPCQCVTGIPVMSRSSLIRPN